MDIEVDVDMTYEEYLKFIENELFTIYFEETIFKKLKFEIIYKNKKLNSKSFEEMKKSNNKFMYIVVQFLKKDNNF